MRSSLAVAVALACAACSFRQKVPGEADEALELARNDAAAADLKQLLDSSSYNDFTYQAFGCIETYLRVRQVEQASDDQLLRWYDDANEPGKNPADEGGNLRLLRGCENSCNLQANQGLRKGEPLPRDLELAAKYGGRCRDEFGAFYGHFARTVAPVLRDRAAKAVQQSALPEWAERYAREQQRLLDNTAKVGSQADAAAVRQIVEETRRLTGPQLAHYRAYKSDPRVPELERRLARVEAQLNLIGRTDDGSRDANVLRRQLLEDEQAIDDQLVHIQREK
jgi:hypothetical protein